MKAMVLCAGFGTRLGALTRDTPKPMLPLAGRPVLDYVLHHLVRHGFTDIVVNLHFCPEVIRDYCGSGARFSARITYSHEAEPLGTAGAVRAAADHFRGGPFLVQYGDVLTAEDLSALRAAHKARGALATILTHRRAGSNSVVVVGADQRVERFLERPTEEERAGVASDLVFSGVLLAEPELLDLIPAFGPSDFPRDVFPRAVAAGRLYAHPLSAYRCAIDSPERLAAAEAAVREGLVG
jgi:mannose-1-phosphate guanylyltransferase/phosphomannomutase